MKKRTALLISYLIKSYVRGYLKAFCHDYRLGSSRDRVFRFGKKYELSVTAKVKTISSLLNIRLYS